MKSGGKCSEKRVKSGTGREHGTKRGGVLQHDELDPPTVISLVRSK